MEPEAVVSTELTQALHFTLVNLIRTNDLIEVFITVSSERQSYANCIKYMKEDTEPKKFTSLAHFFSNHYNQMMKVLLGWPSEEKLEACLKS
jgi:hypothetical protein